MIESAEGNSADHLSKYPAILFDLVYIHARLGSMLL